MNKEKIPDIKSDIENKTDTEKSIIKKEDKPKKKKEGRFGNSEVDKFNILVKKNKSSCRPWYYGLEGNWWWGMTEEDARIKIKEAQKAFENILKMPVISISQKQEKDSESMTMVSTEEDNEKTNDIVEKISDISEVKIKKEDDQKIKI